MSCFHPPPTVRAASDLLHPQTQSGHLSPDAINPGGPHLTCLHGPAHLATRLSRHALTAAPCPHTANAALCRPPHTSPPRVRRPCSTPTQLRVSPPTPLCSATRHYQQLATNATIKVSASPQPSTHHIKRATLPPPHPYLAPSQHSLHGPCTQMPTLKNVSNAVESAVNLAERAIGVDIDKDGDIGVNLTQP